MEGVRPPRPTLARAVQVETAVLVTGAAPPRVVAGTVP